MRQLARSGRRNAAKRVENPVVSQLQKGMVPAETAGVNLTDNHHLPKTITDRRPATCLSRGR